MTDAPPARRIGWYSLEVGPRSGSFAQFEPEQEEVNAPELRAALAQDPQQADEQWDAAAAVEQVRQRGADVTDRVEQVKDLTLKLQQNPLELGNVTGEIDGLLDLLAWLDKNDRFEEEFELLRSLNGLLVLALRWYDLVRWLRSLLAKAKSRGHAAAQAWAHHELGSLYLCAGEAKEAADHLGEALRIEDELGDLPSRCPTRHNLDAARRDLLREAGERPPPNRLLRLAGLAVVLLLLGIGGTGIAFAVGGGGHHGHPGTSTAGTGTTTRETGFAVHVTFSPANARASATVSLTCSDGGKADPPEKTATASAAASFEVRGFEAGATCTATELPLAGYRTDDSACRAVAIPALTQCTIANLEKHAPPPPPPPPTARSFTVEVTFVPPSTGAAATVSLACTAGGTPDERTKTASASAPATFTVRRSASATTCSATETAPAGYASDDTACKAVPIAAGTCTIANTQPAPASADFTVGVTFSPPDDKATATIEIVCTSGTLDAAAKTATASTPATFSISGFAPGATCTATEKGVAATALSYDADDSQCQAVAIARGGCTISNTQKPPA